MSNNFELMDNAMIKLLPSTKKSVQILCQHAGKIATEIGEVRYVSTKDLKQCLEDSIGGFIVPVPEISGPIWNEKLAKMCKMAEDDRDILNELFDDEIEISAVRSWYYENLTKYILRTYMLPLKRFCKGIGKEILFDLGNIEMQYDLMGKGVNPVMLKEAGISLLVHNETGNIEKELGFFEDDFVITGDFLERCARKEDVPKVLLIKPTRGTQERLVQGEVKKKPNRLETPALLAAVEGTYYCDMLIEKGYSFDVVDESHIPKISDLKKYENILVCKSCLFTPKERTVLDKLQKAGIRINDKDLIYELEKGED